MEGLDLSVKRTKVKDDTGVLYLLYIDLDNKEICKIGITSREQPQKRWLEILESCWKWYRIFPQLYPKRFRKVDKVSEKEKVLLDYLSEYRYTPEKPVQGKTEMVHLDRELVVQAYEMIAGDKMILDQWEACPKCGKSKKFSIIVDGKEIKVCGHKCELESK